MHSIKFILGLILFILKQYYIIPKAENESDIRQYKRSMLLHLLYDVDH